MSSATTLQDSGNDRNVEKPICSEDAEIRIELSTRLTRQVPGRISDNSYNWKMKQLGLVRVVAFVHL